MKNYFNNNSIFKNVYVKGEVAGKFESSIHHLYFDLKDKESYIPCVIYRWNRNKIGFEVENGMQLLVTANVILYPPQAKMELDIQSATDDGLGRLHIAYQQLKKKLNEEGLFDVQHKKELPKFPKKIGVVTSVGGSVIHDIIKTVEKRWPYCEVLLFPAAVQGANSKQELVNQIQRSDDFGIDVLIIARGGGNLKEMWSFNEEEVVRAIFECKTPVISAIGHEDNVTLSDLVADKRASTPTMAAGMAIQNKDDIQNNINHLNSRLLTFIYSKFDKNRKEFENILSKPLFRDFTYIYADEKSSFDNLTNRFDIISSELINSKGMRLSKIKQEYVIRHPCKMQIDTKKHNLNELQTRLIDSMNFIINSQRVNLDKATGNFKFQSEKLLTNKKHSLEISKSYLKTNPCQDKIDLLKNNLDSDRTKLNREMKIKLQNDQKELEHILSKPIFKSPETIYLDKSRKFNTVTDKLVLKSNEVILKNNNDLNSIKNNSIIKNPKTIHIKRKDDLNRLIDKFTNKSREMILTNFYHLNSVKNKVIIKNHLKDYLMSNKNQLDGVKSDSIRNFNLTINENKKHLNIVLSSKVIKNPKMIYESQYFELNRIKTSKIIKDPYLMLDDYKQELKIYEEKLDKINQILMLKKEQQKQKTIYIIIMAAIIVVVILIIIFGGII